MKRNVPITIERWNSYQAMVKSHSFQNDVADLCRYCANWSKSEGIKTKIIEILMRHWSRINDLLLFLAVLINSNKESKLLWFRLCSIPIINASLYSLPEWDQFQFHAGTFCYKERMKIGFRFDTKREKLEVSGACHWYENIWKWKMCCMFKWVAFIIFKHRWLQPAFDYIASSEMIPR